MEPNSMNVSATDLAAFDDLVDDVIEKLLHHLDLLSLYALSTASSRVCRLIDKTKRIREHVEEVERSVEGQAALTYLMERLVARHDQGESITPEMYAKLLTRSGKLLKEIKREHRTPAVCAYAVRSDGRALRHVPYEKRTKTICELAVKQNGLALHYVPAQHRTQEMCKLALAQNGLALETIVAWWDHPIHRYYIDKVGLVTNLNMAAVTQNGLALHVIPRNDRTQQLIDAAVAQNPTMALEERQTEEECLKAVDKDGLVLRFVREDLRTPTVCTRAVSNNGKAIQYVPEALRDEDMCILAVRQNGNAIKHLVAEEMTRNVCIVAMRQNARLFHHVSYGIGDIILPHRQDKEVYRLVVQQLSDARDRRAIETCSMVMRYDGMALEYIPEEKRTRELCELAVKQNGAALQYVPVHLRTRKMHEWAGDPTTKALKDVPREARTFDMCRKALERDGMQLEFVKLPLRTDEELRRQAQRKQKEDSLSVDAAARYLRQLYDEQEAQARDLCQVAVEENVRALEFVPRKYQTFDMCKRAVRWNGMVLKFVEFPWRTAEEIIEQVNKEEDDDDDDDVNRRRRRRLYELYEEQMVHTRQLCDTAVEQDVFAFLYVPPKYKTEDMCRMVVEQQGWLLQHVPGSLRTREVCRLAAEQFKGIVDIIVGERAWSMTDEEWRAMPQHTPDENPFPRE